ncbi:MAG: M23 family metallopeptidase, partial [Bacteroidota bacterium]
MHVLKRFIFILLFSILLIGFVVPENFTNPVSGSKKSDYNQNSFWYYPWGKSVTHKGVDIFAKKGTHVVSSTSGIVLFAGEIKVGGKVVLILGPKWRLHYYAHLDSL